MGSSGVTDVIATIGVDEAAELLGVNRYTLYRWARQGKVPCIRLGSSVRFRVAALARWMDEQESQSDSGVRRADDDQRFAAGV